MLVMVVFFIAFRWIHLSTPLIRLFLLVLILLLMPTLNYLPVWFALSLLRFRLPSRLPMMFILWMVAIDRKSGSAGMPRPISYAVFCLKKKTKRRPNELVVVPHCTFHLYGVAARACGSSLCAAWA